jgi:hypothetical protein
MFGFGKERRGSHYPIYVHLLFSQGDLMYRKHCLHPLFPSPPQSISNVAGLRLLALSVIFQD